MEAKFGNNDLLEKSGAIADTIDLSNDPSLDLNPLHTLQQAIAAMPAIDQDKVAAVISKLNNGKLGILGTDAERLACAQRIAAGIMEETLNSTIPDTKNDV